MSLCMYVMPDTCLSGTGFGVRFESFSGVQIEAISGVQNEVPTNLETKSSSLWLNYANQLPHFKMLDDHLSSTQAAA